MPTHRVVTMDELTQYLHLPEKAVAKQLGICLTSLKKLCRQHGITRWPYRKLKSLDKKIAKAENGTGVGCEDIQTLRAKAEELKKEKMAVAFMYGLKEKNEAEDSDASAVSSVAVEQPKSHKKKPPAERLPPGKAASPASAHGARWGGDEKSIPTPPDEQEDPDDDLFAEEEHRMQMLDENGMNPTVTGWEGENDDAHRHPEHELHDSVKEETPAEEEEEAPHGLGGGEEADEGVKHTNTAQVELNGQSLSGSLEKDQEGTIRKDQECTIRMTRVLPNSLSGPLKSPPSPPPTLSDAEIASALASARHTSKPPPPAHTPASPAPPAHQPQFDVDGEHSAFNPELMDSEFFSELPSSGAAHADDDCLVAHAEEELSPGSTSSSAHTVPEVHVPEMCDLPPNHSIAIPGEWDSDAHTWFSPDTPGDGSKGGEKKFLKGGTPSGSPAPKSEKLLELGFARALKASKTPEK